MFFSSICWLSFLPFLCLLQCLISLCAPSNFIGFIKIFCSYNFFPEFYKLTIHILLMSCHHFLLLCSYYISRNVHLFNLPVWTHLIFIKRAVVKLWTCRLYTQMCVITQSSALSQCRLIQDCVCAKHRSIVYHLWPGWRHFAVFPFSFLKAVAPCLAMSPGGSGKSCLCSPESPSQGDASAYSDPIYIVIGGWLSATAVST